MEVVISRLKTLKHHEDFRDYSLSELRIVAISATIPNLQDLGNWLDCPRPLKFDDSYRPVKL